MDNQAVHPEVLSTALTRKLENKKRLIFYTSLFFFVGGCFGVVLTQGLTVPIERGRLLIVSLWIGAALCALFSFLSVYLLRGYATTTRAIIPTLVVGGIGFFLCSGVLTFYLNYALDFSKPRTHEVNLLLRQEVPGHKPVFYVAVTSWMEDRDVITFPVTRQQYDLMQADRCRITTKAGRFGFEWLVSAECGPAPETARRT